MVGRRAVSSIENEVARLVHENRPWRTPPRRLARTAVRRNVELMGEDAGSIQPQPEQQQAQQDLKVAASIARSQQEQLDSR
jgi:hypothetical protein